MYEVMKSKHYIGKIKNLCLEMLRYVYIDRVGCVPKNVNKNLGYYILSVCYCRGLLYSPSRNDPWQNKRHTQQGIKEHAI